ncbi:YceI family protein [Mucilaginibacter myungsuensis]|uniref:YceI family protein n=1 Tax=Mucilaginibacter myungsuensis TaxID=649104 RepID=A0A929L1J0_9SPHI|nr:YceI family protein [Mucilaginibacter myungsuensis]MBE9663908.1 YceI family protein [Mucilaginibacter myungsuensis]MDN3598376.1 YceI family protein [Mucilaginibacter myungsuensis]
MLWIALSAPAQTRWVVQENSSLSVHGRTNVNKFTCDIPTTVKDTITLTKTADGVKLDGSISPATLSFDCHKAMMTRDLQKTLKAKQYPNLHIRFLNLSTMPELSTSPAAITGDVELEIAGTKKIYSINYQIATDDNKMIHLSGSQEICFSDLKLIPPQKMGGMIKTKDQLVINFHLKMRAI